jgi:energy-coupling factor transport system ATP-binding protein
MGGQIMAIRLDAVSHQYKGIDGSIFEAISNIHLTLGESKQMIALVGETGSGKSTLVQHFNALLIPTTGTVEVMGIKVNQETVKAKKFKKTPIRKHVGLVFQFPEYQLFEETVLKDVSFGPKNLGLKESEAINKAKIALSQVGLDESYHQRSPFQLSGGEKKRVSIAGILAMEPDILILDEPTSGLDPAGQKSLMELFKTIHQNTQTTMVFITHDMNVVYRYADRILVMHQSHLVYDGIPSELYAMPELVQWNLDLPDSLKLQKFVIDELGLSHLSNDLNMDALVKLIKEGHLS